MSIFNDSFNHLSLDLAAHHKVEADFEIHSCSEFALIGSSKAKKDQLNVEVSVGEGRPRRWVNSSE